MNFFDFKNTIGRSRFLTPAIFYIDGWMGWDGMGWDGMGWMVDQLFFFDHILETTQYFFSILLVPLNICFCTSFEIFKKNRIFCFFSKNFGEIQVKEARKLF